LHGKRKKRVRRGGAGSAWQRPGDGRSRTRGSLPRVIKAAGPDKENLRSSGAERRPKYGGPERAYDR